MSALGSAGWRGSGSSPAGAPTRIREFRLVDSEDVYRIRRLAFGGPRGRHTTWAKQESGWCGLVAEQAGELVGFVRIWQHRQYFGGAAVPMGGVAAVSVDPHARGAGVASGLLAAAIERMRADGLAVSALYPSVPALYRSRGWEQVGVRQWVERSIAGLPRSRGGGARPATEADVPAMQAAYRQLASTVDGMVDRAPPVFDTDDFLDLDIAEVVPCSAGIAGYLLADRPDGDVLNVHDFVATNLATAETLLDLIASWSGLLEKVSLQVFDPLAHELFLELPHQHRVRTRPWMLRVVDFPAAVAARGWPRATMLRRFAVDVEIDDKYAPWHHGRYRLVCENGAVHCEPGGTGAVRLTARGLACWYAGATTTATLRRGALLDGDPVAASRLDALTGAPRLLRMADCF